MKWVNSIRQAQESRPASRARVDSIHNTSIRLSVLVYLGAFVIPKTYVKQLFSSSCYEQSVYYLAGTIVTLVWLVAITIAMRFIAPNWHVYAEENAHFLFGKANSSSGSSKRAYLFQVLLATLCTSGSIWMIASISDELCATQSTYFLFFWGFFPWVGIFFLTYWIIVFFPAYFKKFLIN